MRALEIISNSWPIAVMFIGFCAACVGFYITRNVRKNAEDKRISYAAQAKDISRRD